MGNSNKHEQLPQEDVDAETPYEKRRRLEKEEREARERAEEAQKAEKMRRASAICEVKNAEEEQKLKNARMICCVGAELWYKEKAVPALQILKEVDALTEATIGDYIKQLPRYNAGKELKSVMIDFDEVMMDEVSMREVLKLRTYKRLFEVEKLLLKNYVVEGTEPTVEPHCRCPGRIEHYEVWGNKFSCDNTTWSLKHVDRCNLSRWTLRLPRELWQGFSIALRVADIKQDISIAEARANSLRDVDWDKIHAQLLKTLTKCMNAEITFTLHAIVNPLKHPEYAFPLISTNDAKEAKHYIDYICYHNDARPWQTDTAAEPSAPAEKEDEEADALDALDVEGMAPAPEADILAPRSWDTVAKLVVAKAAYT